MAGTSGAKKAAVRAVLVCAIIIGILMTGIAHADIPAGVKREYQYNTTDSSILIVKNRLRDLGYFGDKKSKFSDFVSEELKTAVMSFQKKNKVKADGVLDKDLLELLFSDDAIGKDGKKKPMPKSSKKSTTKKNTSPIYATKAPPSAKTTKKPAAAQTVKTTAQPKPEETDLSELWSQEAARAENRNQIVIPILIAAAGVCILAVIVRVVSSAGREKRQSLAAIMDQYRKFKQNETVVQAIREAGIVMSVLASGGEYFLIPLRQKGDGFRLRYSRHTVKRVEKHYGTKIVSMLDRIARNGLRKDKMNRRVCDVWGSRKDGGITVTTDVGKEAYESTRHLFTSLGSSRVIKGNAWVTWDAFLLLVWECALNENIRLAGIAQKNLNVIEQDSGPLKGYQEAVAGLYKVLEFSAKDIIYMMTAKEYIENGRTPWHTVFARNRDAVRDIVREIR